MEVFGNFLNWADKLIFGGDQDSAPPVPTEQTVAPHNLHTIQFDITLKPIEVLPDIVPIIDDTADSDLTPILDELLNSFIDDTDDYGTTDFPIPDVNLSNDISSTIIAEDNGNSIVKVVEDATGKTVELWHEVVAETTTTANKILNTTKTASSSASEVSYVNDYVIAALVLILVVIACLGVLFWCRSNRLKTEKRNKYPVMAVVNNEYMNPQMLKNNDKLKNIP
ncbi:unnamed protein product [Ceutorhynchus assimilis]|uniref:Uncharacterized protein n=1 Tax=Ceutorhynchus assimilis TaxID=467358 RepID=A0A9N9QPX6_9CUCU|nr:unnamed protein product [Ceutorhynchus assimilis]